MKPRILLDARAVDDLEDQFNYIAMDNLGAAARFTRAAEETFLQLVQMPNMGRHSEFQSSRLSNVRQWRIPGFENHLIFYRPIEDGIEVLRVLHGARDIERLFNEGEPENEA